MGNTRALFAWNALIVVLAVLVLVEGAALMAARQGAGEGLAMLQYDGVIYIADGGTLYETHPKTLGILNQVSYAKPRSRPR